MRILHLFVRTANFYISEKVYHPQRSTFIISITAKRGPMKISDSKEFGKYLKERRKKLGYTQAYISEVMGLSVSFISDLENGKKTVELEKAIRYANMLGTDMILESRG